MADKKKDKKKKRELKKIKAEVEHIPREEAESHELMLVTEDTVEDGLVDIKHLQLEERQQVVAELLARGLQPHQLRRALGVHKREIDEWLKDPVFRAKVELFIQERIMKAEDAKQKADEILLKGGNVLGLILVSLLNLSSSMAQKVAEIARDPNYEFSRNDQGTAMGLLQMYRELKSELNSVQMKDIYLNEGADGPKALAHNWNNKAGVRVMRIVEKTRDLAAREGISIEEAQRRILEQIELIDN